ADHAAHGRRATHHRALYSPPPVPQVPSQEKRQHPPRRAALFRRASKLQHHHHGRQQRVTARMTLRPHVNVHRRAYAPRTRRRRVLVRVREATLVLGQIVDVLGDQRPAQIAGLTRRLQALFRGRRRESDGRAHGGRLGGCTLARSPPPPAFSSSRLCLVPPCARAPLDAHAAIPREQLGTAASTTPGLARAGTTRRSWNLSSSPLLFS